MARLGMEEGEFLCGLVSELAVLLKIEGGKNRRLGYDIITEMAGRYSPEKISSIFQMIAAGLVTKKESYISGSIHMATALVYAGREKVVPGAVEAVLSVIELPAIPKKVHEVGKAVIGFMAVLLMDSPYFSLYAERAFAVLECIPVEGHSKLKDNMSALFRRVSEDRNISHFLTAYQKTFLEKTRARRGERSDTEVFVGREGKIEIRKREERSGKRERVRARSNKRFKK
jgi:hypothetical protein